MFLIIVFFYLVFNQCFYQFFFKYLLRIYLLKVFAGGRWVDCWELSEYQMFSFLERCFNPFLLFS